MTRRTTEERAADMRARAERLEEKARSARVIAENPALGEQAKLARTLWREGHEPRAPLSTSTLAALRNAAVAIEADLHTAGVLVDLPDYST